MGHELFVAMTCRIICRCAFLRHWQPSAQEVAAFTASCEKYVGTESGGMDQAISIMGQNGLAKLVHFKPVRHLC